MCGISRLKSRFMLFILLLILSVSARADSQIIIQLKWLHQFQFAGYYAALEQGFFAEEGLQVTLRERDPNQNIVQQVLSAEAHYGIADSILLIHQARHEGVVLVAPIMQHSPNVIMTLKGSGIEGPRDLIGKRIAFYENDSDGISLLALLSEQGVLQEGVIRHHWDQRIEKLLSGELDAVPVYSTNEPLRLRELGIEYHLIDPKHFGIDLYGDMLFTSTTEAQLHPQRVDAVRRAVLRGWHYAVENKAEMVELIYQRYNTQQKSREALMHEAEALELLIERHSTPLGTLNTARLEYILQLLQRSNLIQTTDQGISGLTFHGSRPNISSLSENDQAYLESLPPLRVAVDPAWPPFEFIDEHGSLSGIVSDYLAFLGDALNLEFELVTHLTWSEILDSARQKELDLLPTASPTPERRQYLNFAHPYLRSPMVIVTHQRVDYISRLAQLHGRRVAVVRDYASDEILKTQHPQIELLRVDTPEEALRAVQNGNAYAYIDSLAVVSYLIRRDQLNNLKISGQTPYSFNLSMGVRNDEPRLARLIDQALANISTEQHADIYNRWVHLPSPEAFPWRQALPWIGGGGGLLLLLLAFSLYLGILQRRTRHINLTLEQTKRELQAKNSLLEIISVTDKLTGTYNRHYLDSKLCEQVEHARRYNRPLSVVLFDLDKFKLINDTYGHQAGDQVLTTFADLVSHQIRHSDTFGRWGGEEFLLICPETTAAEAASVAEKIRSALELHTFPEHFEQSVSAGAMQLSGSMSVDQLISGADKKLYQSKQSGRNRVTC
ncbi:diguanylate cyclase/phosphodiesterase (GGDEF & EAL domains) with PAS/PAC sensor(s) [Nitrincola lacisaponensis]|uniref:diguanylate cyclase n=2 Tax=Nitrincola lacisaponensis TaxID=267850 RepID=A0A063Y4I3_9GAMM|nr:diguanylate cyclase/phosphodiesterase (GGDEF & EAL domains) with PAS/PAC sensor(s) [Nitrincola lacisaponensis]